VCLVFRIVDLTCQFWWVFRCVHQKDRHKDKHKDKKKKKKKDGDTNGDAHGKSFSLLLSFCYTGMPNVPRNLPEFTLICIEVRLECRVDRIRINIWADLSKTL
jgi:hypothetical protein